MYNILFSLYLLLYSVFKVLSKEEFGLTFLMSSLGSSFLVGLSGLEPPTSRLSGVRSNRLSYKPIFPGFSVLPQAFGGDKRDRTADPLLAKQVLSQLSYTPVYLGQDPEN